MQFDQSKIIETHLNKKPPSVRRMVKFKAYQLLLPWLYIFVWTISTNLNL